MTRSSNRRHIKSTPFFSSAGFWYTCVMQIWLRIRLTNPEPDLHDTRVPETNFVWYQIPAPIPVGTVLLKFRSQKVACT